MLAAGACCPLSHQACFCFPMGDPRAGMVASQLGLHSHSPGCPRRGRHERPATGTQGQAEWTRASPGDPSRTSWGLCAAAGSGAGRAGHRPVSATNSAVRHMSHAWGHCQVLSEEDRPPHLNKRARGTGGRAAVLMMARTRPPPPSSSFLCGW